MTASSSLHVHRLRPSAQLPHRATPDSSGLDVYADFGHPGGAALLSAEPRLIPTGLALAPPLGFEIQVRPRSGLSLQGVVVAFGTIDADYRGELHINMSAQTSRRFLVRQGDRIAQIVLAPLALLPLEEVEGLPTTVRGSDGFGSSGR